MPMYFVIPASVVLLAITVQDFRSRLLSWSLLAGLFIIVFAGRLYNSELVTILIDTAMNAAYLLFVFGLLFFVHFLKHRTLKGFINGKVGLGDLLFFLCLCPSKEPLVFIVMFNSSVIFSLIAYLLTRKHMRHETVPLAGLVSIPFMVFFILDFLFPDGFQKFFSLWMIN